MSDYLPPEVIRNILLRVPVRSLITCSTVCKSWKSMIEDPLFMENHIDSNLLLLKALINVAEEVDAIYVLHNPENGEFTKLINPSLLFDPLQQFRRFGVIGTCNGLICISAKHKEFRSEMTILWNPCIRKYVQLPSPSVSVTSDDAGNYAFGYDWRTNDYKVLRCMVMNFESDLPERKAEIFSLARGCWKSVGAANVPRGYLYADEGEGLVFVNGALHSFQYEYGVGGVGYDNFVTSFDMSSELFGEVLLPQVLREQDHGIYISKYCEALACVSMPYALGAITDTDIWVMTDYNVMESWTKLFTVHLDLQGTPSIALKSFGIRCNGEIMIDIFAMGLLSVGEKGAEAKIISKYDGIHWHRFVDSYVESHVLLCQANAVSY